MQEPWFAVKRYGVGIRPSNWKGWATVAALVAALVLLSLMVPPPSNPLAFALGALVAVGTFAAIVWIKRPRGS